MRVFPKMAMAGVALILVATACGGSSKSASPSDPTTTVNTAPPAGPSPVVEAAAEQERAKQEVLDAYLANWKAWDTATDPANPDFPGLAETRTGPALEAAVDQISAWKFTGRVAHDPANSISRNRPEVVSVDGEKALVRDCSVDDGLVVIAATGEVVNDIVETALFEASMVIEDGRWKVQSLKVVDTWEGVAGCAE